MKKQLFFTLGELKTVTKAVFFLGAIYAALLTVLACALAVYGRAEGLYLSRAVSHKAAECLSLALLISVFCEVYTRRFSR